MQAFVQLTHGQRHEQLVVHVVLRYHRAVAAIAEHWAWATCTARTRRANADGSARLHWHTLHVVHTLDHTAVAGQHSAVDWATAARIVV